MEYLKPSFQFHPGRNEAYRKNYDLINWGSNRKTNEEILEEKRATAPKEDDTLPKKGYTVRVGGR